MDVSHYRDSGKQTRQSGQRLRSLLIFTAAIGVVVWFWLELTAEVKSELTALPATTDCAASQSVNHLSECPNHDASNGETDSTNAVLLTEPLARRDENTDAPDSTAEPEAGPLDVYGSYRLNVADLSSGATKVELCDAFRPDGGSTCRLVTPGNKRTAANPTSAPPDAGLSISGKVLTSSGVGLPGVVVIAMPERLMDQTKLPASGNLRFWTETDSLGAYAIDGLPDGEYTIRTQNHGQYRSARTTVKAGVNYADLLVMRNVAVKVSGQVFGDYGEPLEGVAVLPNLLGQPSVLSGPDGRYQLAVAVNPVIEGFTLRFERPGYREFSQRVTLSQSGRKQILATDTYMQPVESWAALQGSIVDDSGNLLSGLLVELRQQAATQVHRATTDQHGHFSFPAIESPAQYQLIVHGGSGYRDYQLQVQSAQVSADLEIVLDEYRFGEVSGQLVNLNGVPVPDFALALRNTSSRQPNAFVSTDRQGNFSAPRMPAGDIVLASQSNPAVVVQGLTLKPGEQLNLPLILDWGQHEIRGVVVDAANNPVPASRVILQWAHAYDGINTRATRRAAADAQGQFAFSNLGPGPHSLRVDAPGYAPVAIEHDLNRQGYNLTVQLN